MTLSESVTDKKAIKRYQTLEKEFNIVHNFRYIYTNTVYTNMVTKIKILCPEHGDFWVEPHVHIKGTLCKMCSRDARVYTTDEFIRRAIDKHGDKFDYSNVNYISSSELVEIICKVHGSFHIRPAAHLYGKGGCNVCVSSTNDEFIRRAIDKHGDKFDYSSVVYVNSITKVDIICKEHGLFSQTPDIHLSSKYGCIKCSNIGSAIKRKTTQEEFISKANIKHNNRYDYSLTKYIKWDEKVDIICRIHGVFSQEANSHLQGHGCRRCSELTVGNLDNYSKYKDKPTSLYYVNINDMYWKIGLTKQTVEKRFKKEIDNGTYIKTIFVKEFNDGWEAYLIEQEALIDSIKYKVNKDESPIKGGWTEVRRVDFINNIKIKDINE